MIFGKKRTYETVLMAVLPEIPKNASGVAQAFGCSPDMVKRSLTQVEAESDVNLKLSHYILRCCLLTPLMFLRRHGVISGL